MTATDRPLIGENVAAVLHGKQDLRIEHRPIVSPLPDEVTIRIRATSLCGSDSHYYAHGRNGDFALSHPMCLGHESAGEIVAIGSNVVNFLVGDRVAIEPGLNCQTCLFCTSGRYNLCQSMRFASSAKTKPHLDGTLQRYFNWPARLCHAIPPQLPFKIAALIEPISVVLQAFDRAHFQPGSTVLVIGAGAVGLIVCQIAKACGATLVVAVDVDERRLDFAKQCGWIDDAYCCVEATSIVAKDNAAAASTTGLLSAKRHAERITLLADNAAGYDFVFECSGVPSSIQTSIFCAKAGAKVVLVGMGHPIVTLPLGQAALREVDLIGVFRYANMFPKAIQMLSTGVIAVDGDELAASTTTTTAAGINRLITHEFSLQRTADAFALMQTATAKGEFLLKALIVDSV